MPSFARLGKCFYVLIITLKPFLCYDGCLSWMSEGNGGGTTTVVLTLFTDQ